MSAYSCERSTDIQAMMQGLLDAPQQIVLNIGSGILRRRNREFEQYRSGRKVNFSNVVVNLDLSESAVGDFRRENRKNMEALERMINESVRFDGVNRLEIKCTTRKTLPSCIPLSWRGEAIRIPERD